MNTIKTLRRAEKELNKRYGDGIGYIARRTLYYASMAIQEAKRGNIYTAESESEKHWAALKDLETLNVVSNTEKWELQNKLSKWIYKYYTHKPF